MENLSNQSYEYAGTASQSKNMAIIQALLSLQDSQKHNFRPAHIIGIIILSGILSALPMRDPVASVEHVTKHAGIRQFDYSGRAIAPLGARTHAQAITAAGSNSSIYLNAKNVHRFIGNLAVSNSFRIWNAVSLPALLSSKGLPETNSQRTRLQSTTYCGRQGMDTVAAPADSASDERQHPIDEDAMFAHFRRFALPRRPLNVASGRWGVVIREVTKALQNALKAIPGHPTEGLYILSVSRPGVSATKGLTEGDLLVWIDSNPTKTRKEFEQRWNRRPSHVLLLRRSDGRQYSIYLTDKQPDFSLLQMSSAIWSYAESPGGVGIEEIEIGSPAAASGLQVGDVVTKFGKSAISTVDQLSLQIRNSPPDSVTAVTIWRAGVGYLDLAVKVGPRKE